MYSHYLPVIQPIASYQLHPAPKLIEAVTTYDEAIQDIPTYTTNWRSGYNIVLSDKALMMNWQTDEQWRNWNHGSTQLLKFHTPVRSLDRSILDYQLSKFYTPIVEVTEPLDESVYFIDPVRTGTYLTLWAARLLMYHENWFTDKSQDDVWLQLSRCHAIVMRCAYICEKTFGERLA